MNSDTHGGDVPSVEWGEVDRCIGCKGGRACRCAVAECVSLRLHQVKACLLVYSVNVALFYILCKKVSFFHICHIFTVYVCVCLSVHACMCLSVHACVCMCLHQTMYFISLCI